MFRKVLVAEDMDSINKAVETTLQSLHINEVVHAQYCDEAYLKAKKAAMDNDPFDLLICDLSFKVDHRPQKLTSGEALIDTLKQDFPDLKIIVHSIEDHPQLVRNLWETGNIDGYVCKDRNGLIELKEAVKVVHNEGNYNSPQIATVLNQKNLYVLPKYESALLTYLANGLTQDQIQQRFREEGISPSSKSAIEKRLKEVREEFNANTTPHLISILKDLRLI